MLSVRPYVLLLLWRKKVSQFCVVLTLIKPEHFSSKFIYWNTLQEFETYRDLINSNKVILFFFFFKIKNKKIGCTPNENEKEKRKKERQKCIFGVYISTCAAEKRIIEYMWLGPDLKILVWLFWIFGRKLERANNWMWCTCHVFILQLQSNH